MDGRMECCRKMYVELVSRESVISSLQYHQPVVCLLDTADAWKKLPVV